MSEVTTCTELARLLGVTRRAAADAQARLATAPSREPITGEVRHDLAAERALLAKAQRERIELQNAVTRGELAPVIVLEQVLAAAGARVAGIFDGIPGALRRRSSLSLADLEFVTGEITKARNIVAGMTLADLVDEPGEHDR
jgi:phage terminase Nu1 subunit (DNA packaging protein)